MPTVTLKVPQDVRIYELTTAEEVKGANGEPLTISARQVVANLLQHIQWVESVGNLSAAMAIHEAFSGASPGDEITLSEGDWRLLCGAIEAPVLQVGVGGKMPGYGFSSSVTIQILPILTALRRCE